MADVKKAVEAVLREEDATLAGEITDTPGDLGGKTRFGLASKYHPELLAQTTFYSTMDAETALQIAVLKLTDEYANPLWLAEIEDQLVANKVLSFGVNAGVENAVWALQVAVNYVFPALASSLRVDGVMGPATIAEANRCMAQSLLNSFRLQMIGYYVSICRANRAQREFLCGWIDRALM